MTLYDVCSDYSLDPAVSKKGRKAAESKAYVWRDHVHRGEPMLLGYHRKYDELHYAKSENANLKGQYV